jgi:hypothetical protein
MSRWFRFYSEAVDDPKVQTLPPELFKAWVNLLCIAARNGGIIGTLHETGFHLRCNGSETLEIVSSLMLAGLLEEVQDRYEPHNWSKRQYKSDTSTERVKRFRKRSKAVSETPPEYRVQIKEKEKEKEKNGKEKKGATMAFVVAGSPEWQAWQRVKKINQPVWSAEHHANGFWFPSLWPQEDAAE